MGDSPLEATTLFVANIAIVLVMAIAFAVASWDRRDEPWWFSWVLANLVIAASLACYTFDRHLPPAIVSTLPDSLLILGFSLRWRAARQFGYRDAPASRIFGPALLFITGSAFLSQIAYSLVFSWANVVLTIVSFAVVWEFWRDRADRLPSRYWLIAAYGAMCVSFAIRIGLGVLDDGSMPAHLPQDGWLIVHLSLGLFHTVATGAFSLSLAYERSSVALRHAATHDALTGALNRGAFEADLRSRLVTPDRKPFAVALLDIDHFKKINDRFGHAAGDTAIRQCAAICHEIVGTYGIVARIGGEEFALILDVPDQDEAAVQVERIRKAIGATRVVHGKDCFSMTVSGGVCHSNDAPADFDELMRLVDGGLYEAKHLGRNRITRKMAA